MNSLRRLWQILARRRNADRDMDEEMRFHLEMEAADLARGGVSEPEARRRAAVVFGGVEYHKEQARDTRPFAWLDDLQRDAKYTLRQLRSSPVFAGVVIATLALGVAAATGTFSVVNSVLLQPLPFRSPERLISINGLSYKGELHHFRTTVQTLELAGYRLDTEVSLTGRGEPLRLIAAQVTPDLFAVLGVDALHGRTFTADEGRPGGLPAVVISTRLWQERFGGSPAVVGEQLVIDGVSRTVAGVMGSDFRVPSRETDLWLPLVINESDAINLWSTSALMLGRLRPGASLEQARAEVRAQVPAIRTMFPWRMPAEYGQDADVVPLHERVTGDIRPTLMVMLAAAMLLLLLVAVNVANLMIARGVTRDREFAIRTAIGAGRARLLRQLLCESLTLALIAGAAGTLLAWWGLAALVPHLPADVPRVEEIRLDARALGFALVVSTSAGLLLGILPGFRRTAARGNTSGFAARSAATGGLAQRQTAAVLVVAEIALAVVLVVAAALLSKSVYNLLAVDPGFRAGELVVAGISPPALRYRTAEARRVFAEDLTDRMRQLPGVRAAAAASSVPLGGATHGSVFSIEGRPDPARETGEWPWADARVSIDSSYLAALGIPLLEGRPFTDDDRPGAPRVALVSRSLAAQYWPAESPIGARLRFPGQKDWITVVGIVGDVKWHDLAEERTPALLLPLSQPVSQADLTTVRLAIRTDADPSTLVAGLRALVAAIEPDAPVSDVVTATSLIAGSVAKPRVTAVLLGSIAGVALLLGAIGVYGLLAYSVTARTREIGVRMALGARPGDALRLVLRRGGILALAGALAGIPAAAIATRGLSTLLFGVEPVDPVIFAGVPLLLLTVALLASWIPARRASRVDPLIALRTDP